MEQNFKLHNRWDIIKTNIKTGKKTKAFGENIILNQFWNRYLSVNNATCLSYIHVGSSTTTPTATDTQLGAKFTHYASANELFDTSQWKTEGVIARQLSCRIQPNTYVGQTVSEVGFAYGTTATNLMTRSLLSDMNGNPLTITIGADEVVDIYGTFYFKISQKHNNNEVNIFLINQHGTSNAIACKTAWNQNQIIYSAGGFAGVSSIKPLFVTSRFTFKPESVFASDVGVAYDVLNKAVTFSPPNIGTSQNNITGGIASMFIGGCQFITPCTGFPQSVITKEVVGTGDGETADFQTAFGLILNNSTAKVFVDDIEVPTTIDFEKPHPNTPLYSLIEYDELSDGILVSGANNAWATNESILFQNPYHAEVGIATFVNAVYMNMYASDDGVNWELAAVRSAASPGTTSVNAAYHYKRYWKLSPYGADTYPAFGATGITQVGTISKNVHLSIPPAAGSTVTVTYQPNVLAKDSNHIIKDIKLTLSFGEYTPT